MTKKASPPPPDASPFEQMIAAYGDIFGAFVRLQYIGAQNAGLLGITSMRIAAERLQAHQAQALRMVRCRDAAELSELGADGLRATAADDGAEPALRMLRLSGQLAAQTARDMAH